MSTKSWWLMVIISRTKNEFSLVVCKGQWCCVYFKNFYDLKFNVVYYPTGTCRRYSLQCLHCPPHFGNGLL